MFYAHSLVDRPQTDWHTLRDHLAGSAELAAGFGLPIGLENAARLAALLHDVGKYTPAFQARLHGDPQRVEHSLAGAWLALRQTRPADGSRPLSLDGYAGELCAYAIAGHHAGLPDRVENVRSARSSLQARLDQFDPSDLSPAWQDEITPDFRNLWPSVPSRSPHFAFQLAFLGRIIFSCLVDGDFKDTEAFHAAASGSVKDREWPKLAHLVSSFQSRFDEHMGELPAQENELNRLRQDILHHCRSRAGDKPGLFTFTVPTGGGKTLASLGFALDHAAAHGLDRIIYVAPYTAIIDQTAAIFKKVLGEDHVLEHHSAIEPENFNPKTTRDSGRSGEDKRRLATEDWAAPVIVTTSVQLFESLFAARPSRCRKLHNIARSVIILDEAQTLPRHLLAPCMTAIDELARNYGCTVVLCTATQPALGKPHFRTVRKREVGLDLNGRELAPDPEHLARQLRRTRIVLEGDLSDEALVEALCQHEQGLIIVNSRRHALDLYRAATAAGLDGMVHLTTRQYPAHRRAILADVRKRLKAQTPCRVIATSLVEAGVDLDFPRVWRAQTGLDQIAQAAGRCNREGKQLSKDSLVTVFTAPDHAPPPEIAALWSDMSRMLESHKDDLLSPSAMEAFFQEVYWRMGDALDREAILEDFRKDATGTDFAYRTVAEKFRMIESGMVPVIIPGDETALAAIADLANEHIHSAIIARRLQPYLVQVPPRARAALIDTGQVAFADSEIRGDQFAVLQEQKSYTSETGLLWEGGANFDGIF